MSTSTHVSVSYVTSQKLLV